MRVLVVGASGVLGRNVVPRLQELGHDVRAIARRQDDISRLRGLGVEAVLGDILDATSLRAAANQCDAALHLATAIPTGPGPRNWGRNDRIRREGTRYLLAACEAAGVRTYIQQSITLLYGDQGQRVVDETMPLQPIPHIQSAADMEAMVEASSLDWCILRGGSFYGPGTHREETWRADAAAGTLRVPGDGGALVSLIHVADMARAVVLATQKPQPGKRFNVVDDLPVTYRELYGYVAAQLAAPAPAPGGPSVNSLACSNAYLKAAFGWVPAYPTYHSGLAT